MRVWESKGNPVVEPLGKLGGFGVSGLPQGVCYENRGTRTWSGIQTRSVTVLEEAELQASKQATADLEVQLQDPLEG